MLSGANVRPLAEELRQDDQPEADLLKAVEADLSAELPSLRRPQIKVINAQRRLVMVSFGSRGTWTAWVFAVAPNGTCWLFGIGLAGWTRRCAEKKAREDMREISNAIKCGSTKK